MNLQTVTSLGAFALDRDQAAADEAFLAAYDRETEIRDSVTFQELLEEMAGWTDGQGAAFMRTVQSDSKQMQWAQRALIDAAFEAVVKAKLKEAAA